MPTNERSRRVIVVDDLRINREGTRAVLETVEGVSVEAPLDFDQALARVDWDGVDYVLVDVADRTRSDTETPGIEVVAMSVAALQAGSRPWWQSRAIRALSRRIWCGGGSWRRARTTSSTARSSTVGSNS